VHGVQVFDIVEILRDIKLDLRKTSLLVLIVAVLFRRADSCLQCNNDPHFCVVLVLIESFVARRIIY
jgi:hypothetical protein